MRPHPQTSDTVIAVSGRAHFFFKAWTVSTICLNMSTPTPKPIVVDDDDDSSHQGAVDNANCGKMSSKPTGRLKSIVWQHFERKEINGVQKAVCNYCKNRLVARSTDGTRHLRDHTKACLLRRQKVITDRRQKDITQYATPLRTIKHDQGKAKSDAFCFDPNVTRKRIARMIIMHEYPLSVVEHGGFNDVLSSLQPLWKPVSRNEIKKEIMDIYEYERAKKVSALDCNQSRIAITAKMWTVENQSVGYMAVTAHFIDDSWTLPSHLLRFIPVSTPHTAEVVCDTLLHCLMDHNFDRKLSALIVDNCSYNEQMIQYLLLKLGKDDLIMHGQLFHIHCFVDTLNLIVKDGLSVISDAIAKIRDSVSFWSESSKRMEKFEEIAHLLGITSDRKLVLDCAESWNSTYLMISTALQYKSVFSLLEQHEGQYGCLPSEKDWELAHILEEKLKSLYDVIQLFSNVKYPTSNLFFLHVYEIRLSLDDWLSSSFDEIKKLARSMIENFEKYWKDIHGILAVACVLDPRYKMKLIEYYFPMLFGGDFSFHVQRVHSLFKDLANEYQSKCQSSNVNSDLDSSSATLSEFCPYKKHTQFIMLGFQDFIKAKQVRSELDSYLGENVLPLTEDFDILGWWKANMSRYPTLSKIARDILAIPVSTVGSGSAFSTSGGFVSPHHRKLDPNTLEALMCSQSWLRGYLGDLESTSFSGYATFFDEENDHEECQEVCGES